MIESDRRWKWKIVEKSYDIPLQLYHIGYYSCFYAFSICFPQKGQVLRAWILPPLVLAVFLLFKANNNLVVFMELCAGPRAEQPYVGYPMSSSQEPCEVGPDGQGRRQAQRR